MTTGAWRTAAQRAHATRRTRARCSAPARPAAALSRGARAARRSYIGQAWKGDKENPQSNTAAAKTIFTVVAVYACFLGASGARRRAGWALCDACAPPGRLTAVQDGCCAAPYSWRCAYARALSLPAAVLCFMGHAAKRKIMPENTRRRAA